MFLKSFYWDENKRALVIHSIQLGERISTNKTQWKFDPIKTLYRYSYQRSIDLLSTYSDFPISYIGWMIYKKSFSLRVAQ